MDEPHATKTYTYVNIIFETGFVSSVKEIKHDWNAREAHLNVFASIIFVAIAVPFFMNVIVELHRE